MSAPTAAAKEIARHYFQANTYTNNTITGGTGSHLQHMLTAANARVCVP